MADDPQRLRQMRAFSSEMVKVGRVVVTLVEENARLHRTPDRQVAVLARWQETGAVLSDRNGRAERILYPMHEAEDRPLTGTLPPSA